MAAIAGVWPGAGRRKRARVLSGELRVQRGMRVAVGRAYRRGGAMVRLATVTTVTTVPTGRQVAAMRAALTVVMVAVTVVVVRLGLAGV